MKLEIVSNRPTIRIDKWDDTEKLTTVSHTMTMDEAYKIHNELSKAIRTIEAAEMDQARDLIMGIGCVADSKSPRIATKWLERNFPSYA